jgi:hypothetical protein
MWRYTIITKLDMYGLLRQRAIQFIRLKYEYPFV